MFGEKSMVCAENNFSPMDLLNFVSALLRTAKLYERRVDRSNYNWLSSKIVEINSIECDLDQFKPLVEKLTPENCAATAVKLQLYADELKSTSNILAAFKNLLEDQYSMQMMETTVKRGRSRRKQNKVRPVLTPPGRQATVCFILN